MCTCLLLSFLIDLDFYRRHYVPVHVKYALMLQTHTHTLNVL